MNTLIPYTLTFRGGLRIGLRDVDATKISAVIPSDTLFAALVDCVRRSGDDVDAWLAPFCASPPFLLTSAFPFAGQVRFYPMPVDLAAVFRLNALEQRAKQLKRIRYFSEGLLRRWLKGELLNDVLFPEKPFDEPRLAAALQGGAFWLTVDEIDLLPEALRRPSRKRHALIALQVWASDIVPHVIVDRVTSAANIFQTGRVIFTEGCGLWFGAQPAAAQSDLSILEKPLAMLQEDGLGADRSTGSGGFTFARQPALALPEARVGRLAYLLSRYHPRRDELPAALSAARSAFLLAGVGGWVNSPDGPAMRRKRVQMVTEGSLVQLPRLPAGDLVDVAPTYAAKAGQLKHKVYRYGLALGLDAPTMEVVDE
jgi:CRISPR-associated protein Csm4